MSKYFAINCLQWICKICSHTHSKLDQTNFRLVKTIFSNTHAERAKFECVLPIRRLKWFLSFIHLFIMNVKHSLNRSSYFFFSFLLTLYFLLFIDRSAFNVCSNRERCFFFQVSVEYFHQQRASFSTRLISHHKPSGSTKFKESIQRDAILSMAL